MSLKSHQNPRLILPRFAQPHTLPNTNHESLTWQDAHKGFLLRVPSHVRLQRRATGVRVSATSTSTPSADPFLLLAGIDVFPVDVPHQLVHVATVAVIASLPFTLRDLVVAQAIIDIVRAVADV